MTPATASSAPTRQATSTRGRRICQKMALGRSPWTGPVVTKCHTSPSDNGAGPKASETRRHATKTPPAKAMPGQTLVRTRRVTARLKPRDAVSYTHLRAHETDSYLVCRLLL